MVRGSHEGGDLDGRRDASEERRPMSNQYVSTTYPKSWRTQCECNYDYNIRSEGKKTER